MAKSNPIGVRFDLEKLEMIQKEQNLTSAQQVVNYLMDNYGKSALNLAYKPVNGIITSKSIKASEKAPINDKKNILEEGTNAFYLEYGAFTYAEIGK